MNPPFDWAMLEAVILWRANEATRAENEACAKILDEYEERYVQKPESYLMGNIAAVIRARVAPKGQPGAGEDAPL